jgi:N-acetylmuramoyl-L-alanine amidase
VLDAGHGGKDPGAIGYNKIKEKDLILPITLKLGKKLNQNLKDVKIVYTRKTDVFIPLWKRTQIANKANGKLFISVHCNSSVSKSSNGFETYFLSADKDEKARGVVLKENSAIEFEETVDRQRYEGVNFILATMAQSAFIKQSQYLASVIQKSLKSRLEKIGMTDRGVKQGPFWVMVGATMPNVLVECGYLSNKYESKKLIKSTTQDKIADAICQGIIKYKKDIEDAI